MTAFNELLSQYIGTSFARQIAFADFLGDRSWSVDLQQGICQFGNDLIYPIQLLGTEATSDSTWLWAWANEASNLPRSLLTSCMALRELGDRAKIPEFSQRSFSFDIADGHSIALVASGIDGRSCYYRGPYDGGALFFLIHDIPDLILQPVASERVVTVISQVASQFIVAHKLMAESFLVTQGFVLESSVNEVVGIRGGERITLSLDDLGRISQIGGNIQPTKGY